ncbi:PhoD-like phosphatase [Planctomycetes bacterium CA13]|uniref:PhoD-like phosphatase n=1 Tax=Novipirellula herctigrandis TaxID=2527986 RepID=A0A5C5Z136_9BACT|nr:PhoD-like phosphatase [Planctomycetes bacterium CA13]
MIRVVLAGLMLTVAAVANAETNYYDPLPFGDDTQWAKKSDNCAIGKWWEYTVPQRNRERPMTQWFIQRPRDETMAFAIYTHDHGILKMTAQCFPLLPEEPKTVTLELKVNGEWKKTQEQPIVYPGWSAHFRVEGWDNSKDVAYRVRLDELSSFEGLIRKDPQHKETLVFGSLNCNSPKDDEFETRKQIVAAIKHHDPDLLFFAGDQNYTHDEATYGWLQFGVQFAEVLKDRPVICIPDDHDVGHGNLWGEDGKKSNGQDGATDGGYMYPAAFVKMVERQQTWNLPDPFDPTPVKQGIGVYYTDLNVGGISFAILEDRKFKSGPKGKIPKMGPRNDHIRDPSYDRKSVDKPGLTLLGDRQMVFLDAWARDWTDAEMKVVLSQTAFCGAVHMHGGRDGRLLADLDCNGWPQTPRNEAVRALRRVRATHLCGDQHLAVIVKHGIEGFRDGPYGFTAPAIVNTIYGRWWHPLDEQPGGGEPIDSPNPWVGDYEDGLGNKITMMAYANPENRKERMIRGDGYGIVRFHKPSARTTLECWPRFADLSAGDAAQYPGWPIRFNASENDGRKPVGYLKEVTLPVENAVVELTNEVTGELVYCFRTKGKSFKAPVYSKAKHTLKAGRNNGEKTLLSGAVAQ